MPNLMTCKWRVGRVNGGTIYAMPYSEPSDNDFEIGAMNSEEFAQHIVDLHNASL